MESATYRDRWIEATADEIRIRGYYFPWGTKTIRYSDIQGVRRVPLTALGGRYRIWGSSTLTYWASLDPDRPRKSTALILDLGRNVKPFVTPDDPDAMIRAILAHTDIRHVEDEGRGPSA
jgi:hypothetical protein